MSSSSKSWGVHPHERLRRFPCDRFSIRFDDVYYRGIGIHAPPETVFRWLCQMRVAPYSYDWIDNLGRRSPPRLIPGLDDLNIGQDVMTIFELIDFTPDVHLTIRLKKNRSAHTLFGDVVVSYLVVDDNGIACRLLVKLLVAYPKGVLGALVRSVLPLGDLIMMRRQLLNFKRLSEQMCRAKGG
jgi:hypothetical protein